MRPCISIAILGYCLFQALASLGQNFGISSILRSGRIAVTNSFNNGVVTVFTAAEVNGPWLPAKNIFTTSEVAAVNAEASPTTTFYRALAVSLAPGREGFTNLVQSFDLLTTIAGAGGPGDNSNKWRPEFEGGYATNAMLSGPHITLSDHAGNLFIADKDSHGIRKVSPDGIITTVAGINTLGNGPDELTAGTNVALANPNGLWISEHGTVYIMDTDNGKIRVLQTNGMMRTLFTVPGGIRAGRGLWVSEDETLAYVSSLNIVKKWTPTEGVVDYAIGFTQLGNLVVDPDGYLVVTDRGTHSVWRVFDGSMERIAGNGTTSDTAGGGAGGLATATGLNEVRGIWFLPTGAYFLCTHRGSQVWYVDTGGFIHLFLNGNRNEAHAGDGTWFWNPGEARVSECRAVTMDRQGNLLVTEHDSGYVRKVQFLRHQD